MSFVLNEILEDHGASQILCVSAHTLVSLLGVAMALLRLFCRCWGFAFSCVRWILVGFADAHKFVFLGCGHGQPFSRHAKCHMC